MGPCTLRIRAMANMKREMPNESSACTRIARFPSINLSSKLHYDVIRYAMSCDSYSASLVVLVLNTGRKT
jgi:hypothetical protein